MLIVFLPLLIVSILLVTLFVYNIGSESKRQEAFYQLQNKIDVASIIVGDKLENILNCFVTLEKGDKLSKALLDIRFGEDKTINNITEINATLDNLVSQNYEMLDSVDIRLNNYSLTSSKKGYKTYSFDEILEIYNNLENPKGYNFIFPQDVTENTLSVIKFLAPPTTDDTFWGYIVLNIKKEYVFKQLESIEVSKNGYWVILSGENVYYINAEDGAELPSKAKNFILDNVGSRGKFETITQNNKSSYVYFDSLGPNWEICAIMPKSELVSTNLDFNYNNILLLLLVVIVMVAFAILLADKLSSSIRALCSEVKTYDTEKHFDQGGSLEVSTLSDALNNMSSTIKDLILKIQGEQKQLREVELSALQEKMKPHFIYNSLSTVLYEVDSNQNETASKMLHALINFFRFSFYKGEEYVTVNEELEQVVSYMEIQKLRNSTSFSYEINIDDDLRTKKILKFSLQPLVENAIKHGFDSHPSNANNLIIISIYEDGNNLALEVFDNGDGIAKENIDSLLKQIKSKYTEPTTDTYGLKNVDLRLRLSYGEEYGISIESETGEESYCSVKISIPL